MTFDDHISVVPVDHGSHVEVLAEYACRVTQMHGTGLPSCMIREYGCGFWSTPMLRGISTATGCGFWSEETDEGWAHKFLKYGTHFVRQNCEYRAPTEEERAYLVFIDCNPPEERMRLLLAWQDHADFIICHDANHAIYKWDFSSFKYKRIYKTGDFHTAVLSMEYEV